MGSLVSAQNVVESPFIIAKIGDYTFGHCSDIASRMKMRTSGKVTFPNYMQSLRIVKINGALNTYTLIMKYAITQNDDPNMLEKVFSSVSSTRKIVLSYGDWNAPSYIYKEEEGIITKIQSQVDFESSSITYTLSVVSTALTLNAGSFSFPSRTAKPSDVLIELLTNKSYGMTDVFTGMRGMTDIQIRELISGDDKAVDLESRENVSVIDYVGYLVNSMVSVTDAGGPIKDANYFWAVYDDVENKYGGTYFKVVKVSSKLNISLTGDTFEVDVGYPSGNMVSSFSIESDSTWSILYNYSESIQQPQYRYEIDDKGKLVSYESPAVTASKASGKTTELSRTWWTQATQFPIKAKLTIKGLLRPSLLMSYVRVNTYFYGKQHISSGLYIITKQEDLIDSSGYRTTLSLTRIESGG